VKYPNQVRLYRLKVGISRDVLAKKVGITVQSIGLIEAGKVSPSTLVALRIARVLAQTVENLFSNLAQTVHAQLVRTAADTPAIKRDQRAFISTLSGQAIARPAQVADVSTLLAPANGLVVATSGATGESEFQLLEPNPALEKTVFISGCDIGLGLLASHLRQTTALYQGVWFNASNAKALQELQAGTTHVAAIHASHPIEARRDSLQLPDYHTYVFAEAEMGWMVKRGNPCGFRNAGNLADSRIKVINRGPGSGARTMVDQEIAKYAVAPTDVVGYGTVARGHMAVADAVAQGYADVGVGHASAAALYGLDFIPVQREICTLFIPTDYLQSEAIQVLLTSLHSNHFRRELHAYGPYDIAKTGNRIGSTP